MMLRRRGTWLAVRMISSTWIRRQATDVSQYKMKREESDFKVTDLMDTRQAVKRGNHARGFVVGHKVISRRCDGRKESNQPNGWLLYRISAKCPCKKALLTDGQAKKRLRNVEHDEDHRVFDHSAKCLPVVDDRLLGKNCNTHRVLYRVKVSVRNLQWWIHLLVMTFTLIG